MPGDLKLGIRLTADAKGFVGEVRVAKRELDRLAGGTRNAGTATAAYTRASQRAEAATRKTGRSFLAAHGHTLKYIGSIGSITLATRGLLRHADSYTKISNSVRLATSSASEQARVQTQLFDIAQRTRAPIGAVADLYQKLSLSQSDLGASGEEMLGVIEGVGQALVISGTDASQASGALLQLSQALGGGVVRAEEFNSILEGAPQILRAAAKHIDGTGGSVAKLRQQANAGELSSRDFFNALQAALPGLAADFDKTNSTIAQGFVSIDNAMTKFVGRLDEVSGASSAVTDALQGFANILDDVDVRSLANALAPIVPVVVALASTMLLRGVVALTAYGGKMAAAKIATDAMALAGPRAAAAVGAFRTRMAAAAYASVAYGRAARFASVWTRRLGAALRIATGPAGWLLLAGSAIARRD